MVKEIVRVTNRFKIMMGQYCEKEIEINCKHIWNYYECEEPEDFIKMFTRTIVHEWVHALQHEFTKFFYHCAKGRKATEWIEYITELMCGQQ